MIVNSVEAISLSTTGTCWIRLTLIETPIGRLAKGSLWQMRILFEPRSQIFDYDCVCRGRVRFTDLQGQQYTLHAGQRLGCRLAYDPS